ncbi:Uncharacterised protein [Candidatus Norongarragalina meridionalis]|nr:Uncharacterised protein [Candidatus Norongarragalina meridionalis]
MFVEGILKWISSRENQFFVLHIIAIAVLAFVSEMVMPDETRVAYPAIILLAAASFMLNYPAKEIKEHGLFAEYLIELRLVWLVLFGVLAEYLVYSFEAPSASNIIWTTFAIITGLLIAFYSRAKLKDKLVNARGWK